MINNKFNTLNITLTSEEHDALRYMINILKFCKEGLDIYKFNVSNEPLWEPLIKIIKLLDKKIEHLSKYSKTRKFNSLTIQDNGFIKVIP